MNIYEKYNIYAYDYIEYPHKSFWSQDWADWQYRGQVENLLASREPFVFYAHIPFCAQMCFFCLCHFRITHDYERVRRYMDSLHAEIDMLAQMMDERPNIREVHFGGGSPTYLREADFENLRDQLSDFIEFDKLDEFALEIDPRAIGRDRLRFYADMGVNRISFGVQDFDPIVGRAINRIQPFELLENLLIPQIRSQFKSVNFDMLVGLPEQTLGSLYITTENICKLRPDRVSLAYVHFNPKQHKHHHVMAQHGMPSYEDRKAMHALASEMLVKAGYIRTGFEHFALPTDDVAKAVEAKTVQYNSLGATPGRCDWLLGVGVSSYGRVGERCYSQHCYDHAEYAKRVEAGEFPVMRGFILDAEDQERRDIIQDLRSKFAAAVEWDKYLPEMEIMLEMQEDGIVTVDTSGVAITELGKNFSIVVCRAFDRHVTDKETGGDISYWPEQFWKGEKVFLG